MEGPTDRAVLGLRWPPPTRPTTPPPPRHRNPRAPPTKSPGNQAHRYSSWSDDRSLTGTLTLYRFVATYRLSCDETEVAIRSSGRHTSGASRPYRQPQTARAHYFRRPRTRPTADPLAGRGMQLPAATTARPPPPATTHRPGKAAPANPCTPRAPEQGHRQREPAAARPRRSGCDRTTKPSRWFGSGARGRATVAVVLLSTREQHGAAGPTTMIGRLHQR